MGARLAAMTLTLLFTIGATGAMADQKAGNQVTSADRAKIKAQVESLQRSKLQVGERANKATRDRAIQKAKNVDQELQNANARVDKHVEGLSGVYGQDAAQLVGEAKKKELSNRALHEKQGIAREAQGEAARQTAAAKKTAAGVNDTVEGLKSQISPGGKFGLKPHGSDLHIRNYGGPTPTRVKPAPQGK